MKLKTDKVSINWYFNLWSFSDEDLQERVKFGQQIVVNRTGWALTYLHKGEAIEWVKRGHYQITKRRQDLLTKYGDELRKVHLTDSESFLEFQNATSNENIGVMINSPKSEEVTPEDQTEQVIILLNNQLSEEILEAIMEISPYFFEVLILDLLFHMGYGGRNREAFEHTQYGHDGGIDGLIKEDELGLDHIYVQAKRWKNTVTSPEIQKFSVALSGRGVNKGVFLTTSTFSQGAIDYASRNLSNRIILIDGKKLAELMIAYDVGVTTVNIYKIQKIDTDYYVEDVEDG